MKKRLIIKFVRGLMLFVFVLLFTGCIQRELDQIQPNIPVNISFNWKNLPAGSTLPTGMVLSFYNSDGTFNSTQKCSAAGFAGNLPEGIYKVLAYNEDTQGVEGRFIEESYDKAQIVASATKAVSITQSSNVYGVGLGELIISNFTAANEELIPNALAKQVTLNIGLSGDKAAIKNVYSTLSGISRAVNISTGALIPEEGVISFIPVSSINGFQSSVSCFGVLFTAKNLLSIAVDFVSGGQQTLDPVDITDELRKALAGTGGVASNINVEIKVEGTIDTGFTATLKGWEVVKKEFDI